MSVWFPCTSVQRMLCQWVRLLGADLNKSSRMRGAQRNSEIEHAVFSRGWRHEGLATGWEAGR